jgi:hypothetical protein
VPGQDGLGKTAADCLVAPMASLPETQILDKEELKIIMRGPKQDNRHLAQVLDCYQATDNVRKVT